MSEKSSQKNYDLLLETFTLLKKKLEPYSKKLIVHTDEKEKYGLVGDKDYTTTSLKTGKTATKHGMHFVDLIIQKGYVGFYFMCAYTILILCKNLKNCRKDVKENPVFISKE